MARKPRPSQREGAAPAPQTNPDAMSPEDAEAAAQAERERLTALASEWGQHIAKAEKDRTRWHTQGDKIIKRYKDERADAESDKKAAASRMNILWSNVQTVLPSIYSDTPRPAVQRRHKDRDPLARAASMVLERALMACADGYDLDSELEETALDFLLVGEGVAWVRYRPTFNDAGLKVWETAEIERVYWKDFLHSPGKTWREVWWGARAHSYTKEEAEEEFGAEKAVGLKMDLKTGGGDQADQARVWEIWDKRAKRIIFLAPSSEGGGILKESPAPLKLRNFFPFPKPLLGTTAGETLIPTPDYVTYQDQALELDDLTQRIAIITQALRLVGVYNSSIPPLKRLLATDAANQMIPVDAWAMFAESGGIKGNVEFLPIREAAEVLMRLYDARDRVKADLYEISGVADIMRGASDPSETAAAQKIKANFGSRRVRRRQRAVQKFVRDLYRIKAEIMSEMFALPTLLTMAGITPENTEIQQALPRLEKFLRDDIARNYRVDIETDSTLEMDEQQDRKDRVEFLTAVSGFLKQAAEVGAGSDALTAMMGEFLMFGVRGFRKGVSLEDAIENALVAYQKEREAQKQQPPPQDPKVAAAAQKAQSDAQKAQQDLQKGQMELQAKALELREREMSLAQQQKDLEIATLKVRVQELELERRKLEMMSSVASAMAPAQLAA